MNIDEYRAMKAQEEENSKDKGDQPNAQTDKSSDEPVQTSTEKDAESGNASGEDTKPEEGSQEENKPDKSDEETPQSKEDEVIEIDGQKVTINELKNGYMRQSDYTRKTQEVKREAEKAQQAMDFMEQVQGNPQLAENLSQQLNNPYLDPTQSKYKEMEDKYYDMLLQNEIRDLESKYNDFDIREVLQTARDGGIKDLDTAYHVYKSRNSSSQESKKETSVSTDQMKEDLRNEILAELKAEQESNVDTSTVIQSGGDTAPIRDTSPKISSQESKVAKMMGMKDDEYAKWRDAKKRK